MNNISKIEAFKSFYEQADTLYKNNKIKESKELFLKSASIANEISIESSSYEVRMEYHNIAEKILLFLKNDFNKTKITNDFSKDNKEKIFSPCYVKEKITFDDVAGLNDVKDEIRFNIIEPLKNPDLAKKYNINPGAIILLYGPPGTGKTYIARAIAGEIEAAFYSINCHDLISKYMGESSKLINSLFDEAQKNKRAIIFFDEFDSIASKRENENDSVNNEMSRFVSTFLTKVDGFEKNEECKMLLLIAATNRPWAIDSAMLRGGRFDIQIFVGLPDEEARNFLIKKELSNIELSDFQDDFLVEKLKGYTSSNIVSICKRIKQIAYRRALKNNRFEAIEKNDVDQAFNKYRSIINDYDLERYEQFKQGKK